MTKKMTALITAGVLAAASLLSACGGGAPEAAAPEAAAETPASAEKTEVTEAPAKEEEKKDEAQEKKEEKAEETADIGAEEQMDAAEAEPALRTIGERTEDGFMVCLTNLTGSPIINIAAKPWEDEKFPKNFLGEEDPIGINEQVVLYYTPEEPVDAAMYEASDLSLRPSFDLKVVLDDGTEKGTKYVLSAFPFEDLEDGDLKFADGVCYVEYKSVKTGEKISTLEAEKAVKQLEEEAAAAEAEAEAEAAAAEAEAEAAAEAARIAAEEEAARAEAEAAAQAAAAQAQAEAEAAAAEEAARAAAEAEAAAQQASSQDQSSEGCLDW